MMVKPWAKATAVMPLSPAPPPTTAAVPAPMNTNEKVPMNSARSLGAIRLDIVDLQRALAAHIELFRGGGSAAGAAADRRCERRYSAAIICGVKLMPIALATPAPYSGSAL